MSPSEKRLKTFINDIQCEILVVDESTLTENIDFSEYSSLKSCILLSENQWGCQGSGLLERRRPSEDRPSVHLSMWTTDQNLGTDRPSHGQIRTLDQDYTRSRLN